MLAWSDLCPHPPHPHPLPVPRPITITITLRKRPVIISRTVPSSCCESLVSDSGSGQAEFGLNFFSFSFSRCLDPPRVGPYEFPNDLQVGMKARAMCSVMQGDAPFKFAWSQDGRRIESDVATKESGAIFKVQTLRDYSMLTVDSLTLAHAGNITCLVSNDGSQTWQSAMLKVNGK